MKRKATVIKLGTFTVLVGMVLLISACAVTPRHLDSQAQDENHHFARRTETTDQYKGIIQDVMNEHASSSASFGNKFSPSIVFTKGDLLRIRFQGMPENDGLYQVNIDGNLELPFAPALSVKGHNRQSLTTLIEDELVRLKWFYKDTVKVNVSLVRLAPVNVAVYGAVFNPGRVSINDQPIQKQEDAIQQQSGAYSAARDIVAALSAAGGVRPDAQLSEIYLKRGSLVTQLSLTALLSGDGFTQTPSLINGDVIVVKTTGIENHRLIKPSQITPPGMRVFMSNLTAPALNNAQSAVGADATRLPYGSSLLDSAISANCIGGTHQANASRSIVLVTRNHGSQRQIVISRSINELLATSSDSSVNPYVMPNDGVACYDSRFTNFRDVARGVVEIVSPLFLGGLL